MNIVNVFIKKKKEKICSESFSKMSGKLVKVYLWGQDVSKDLDHLWVLINQNHWLSVRSRCQRFRAGQWLDVKVCVCVCMCVCACARIFSCHIDIVHPSLYTINSCKQRKSKIPFSYFQNIHKIKNG